MMSDMSFLTPSLWANELPLMKDGLSEYESLSDLPFDSLDQDINNWDLPSSYQNSEISVANSECSDSQSIDIDGDLEDTLLQNVLDADLLSSAIVTNSTSSSQPEFELSGGDYLDLTPVWSGTEGDEDIWSTESGNEESVVSHSTRERSLDDVIKQNIVWSSLSVDERMSLAEELSSVVSTELGLREQLDIIRIINPTASISPADTQFVIDVTCMTDEKLREISSYLHQQSNNNNNHDDNKESRTGHHSNHSNHQGNRSPKCSGNTSDRETSCTSYQNRKTRKRSHKQLINKRRVRPRQKLAKQQLKEEKSGLFTQEQVVSVDTEDSAELDDVDILT